MFACIWALQELLSYPGIRIIIGRKEMTRLKQTTVATLFSKAHPLFSIKRSQFQYQDQKGLITYPNGSSIQLVDLARQPSDPDFDTFGSLEVTHAIIEEAGEIVKKAKDVVGSRVNRFLNEKYGIVGKLLVTGNPSQNFTRGEYYDPYIQHGGGDHQKWQHGEVFIDGELTTSYRAFIKSLVTDNPTIDPNYIERLKMLPEQERKRLFEGNWDYMDDESSLFKALLLDRAMISEYEGSEARFIGVDVADKGKDKTIATLVNNGVAVESKVLSVNTEGEKAISEMTAMELIKFAQQRGFSDREARNIAIEGNGVGVGVRDFMRSKGWFITEYVATAQSRSQGYYDLSVAFDKGELKLLNTLDNLDELRKQLMVMTYEFDDKLKPKVLEKKKIKEALGYSPDHADSLMIANWIKKGGVQAKKKTAIIF